MFFKNKKGFSLVEVLVAVAILTVLSVVLVPSFLSISKDSKEARDDIKFESIAVAFERTLSEEEVLISLEKNHGFNNKEQNDNNIIHVCFEIDKEGLINFESGTIFYNNGLDVEPNFTKSKIWLNTYQSLDKKYVSEHKENKEKILVFTIHPKTLNDVAYSEYATYTRTELPNQLKGKI